jgi:hypothetical protein
MALQSSGAISLSDIQTEFGGSNPISLSEYYGVDTVPASGAISMSQFYGTSNAYTLSYLVIAGGAAGGGQYYGGGGGAGGYRNSYGSESSGANSASLTAYTVTGGTSITVTIGAGGAGGRTGMYGVGYSGSASQISGSGLTTRATTGGGGGGGYNATGDAGYGNGDNGGSGGGYYNRRISTRF